MVVDDDEIILINDLTKEELVIILGTIANTTPTDREIERKLFTIYTKLRRKVYPT